MEDIHALVRRLNRKLVPPMLPALVNRIKSNNHGKITRVFFLVDGGWSNFTAYGPCSAT